MEEEYLQCLLEYVGQNRVGPRLHASQEYLAAVDRAGDAYGALKARLDAGNQSTVDSLCDARDEMFAEESRAMFLEGVSLGKWMARG